MIIDFHAHVFPLEVCQKREDYVERDPTFALLYSNPKTRLATAAELLADMDEAGVDKSVMLNFVWRDPAFQRYTNDYILESAAAGGGRLVPFCMVDPGAPGAGDEIERCAREGARGLGELRPEDQGYGLGRSKQAELLAWAARELRLVLLFHVSEPVGHEYPGKSGLPLTALYQFIEERPDVTVVASHWGGGLPFYSLMPRVRRVLHNTYVDSAATGLLYEPSVYRHMIAIMGAERILFGSDFPYLTHARCLREFEKAGLGDDEKRLILGGNAARLLGLSDDG